MRALVALLPIAASLVVIAALQRYPLHGARYQAMRAALRARRDG
jgi:Na+/melibiose symporter-like transporter